MLVKPIELVKVNSHKKRTLQKKFMKFIKIYKILPFHAIHAISLLK